MGFIRFWEDISRTGCSITTSRMLIAHIAFQKYRICCRPFLAGAFLFSQNHGLRCIPDRFVVECYCFLIIIMVDVPEGCRSVSPTPNTYFFHFRASRARRTMTVPPTSFVVVILFWTTFVDRLRTLVSVPSSLSVRLRAFWIYPCNLQSKRGSHAKRVIHP